MGLTSVCMSNRSGHHQVFPKEGDCIKKQSKSLCRLRASLCVQLGPHVGVALGMVVSCQVTLFLVAHPVLIVCNEGHEVDHFLDPNLFYTGYIPLSMASEDCWENRFPKLLACKFCFFLFLCCCPTSPHPVSLRNTQTEPSDVQGQSLKASHPTSFARCHRRSDSKLLAKSDRAQGDAGKPLILTMLS